MAILLNLVKSTHGVKRSGLGYHVINFLVVVCQIFCLNCYGLMVVVILPKIVTKCYFWGYNENL